MNINKKGFLLAEETLKIIISVIAITFLIYFLVSLYNVNKDSNDLELAQASLDHLLEEINVKSPEVEIYNPKGWSLVSWLGEGGDLRACSNFGWEECICICQSPGWVRNRNILENCNSGYCLESEGIIIENTIEIEDVPAKLNIVYSKEGEEVSITRG